MNKTRPYREGDLVPMTPQKRSSDAMSESTENVSCNRVRRPACTSIDLLPSDALDEVLLDLPLTDRLTATFACRALARMRPEPRRWNQDLSVTLRAEDSDLIERSSGILEDLGSYSFYRIGLVIDKRASFRLLEVLLSHREEGVVPWSQSNFDPLSKEQLVQVNYSSLVDRIRRLDLHWTSWISKDQRRPLLYLPIFLVYKAFI